jgi:DNA-binding transcriptional LysR family regulator
MSSRNIEIRHLRYFVAVAQELSFRGAALRLHISQPPLTRQIQQLEEELGVELLSRHSKGVDLTPAGVHFLEEAENILTLTDRAAERTALVGNGLLGRLDVGIFGSATLDVIPKLVLSFRNTHPNVDVALHNLGRHEQLKALREKRLTVGFNRFVADEPDIVAETVLIEGLQVAMRRGDPLSKQAEVSVSELADRPLVLYPSAPRPSFLDRVVNLCRHAGFEPVVAQEVDDVTTAVALVASGFGVSVVPDSARSLRLPGVVFKPLERKKSTTVDLCCLYRKSDDSAILREFLHVVRTYEH